ncbi:MAG: hypothetical protein MK207_16415, partial [Saprospiraceae bacterium]|nr:hypothetical protein [Saprospiraceae bacterium]
MKSITLYVFSVLFAGVLNAHNSFIPINYNTNKAPKELNNTHYSIGELITLQLYNDNLSYLAIFNMFLEDFPSVTPFQAHYSNCLEKPIKGHFSSIKNQIDAHPFVFSSNVPNDRSLDCSYSNYAGCTDTLACNYDPLATVDDGSCSYAISPLDCSGNCANGGVQVVYTPGSWSNENGFTITDCNGTVLASMALGSGYDSCIVLGAIYTIHLTDSYGDGWNGGLLTVDGIDYTISTGSAGSFEVGTCPIPGCTDSLAVNYNPLATLDDNSCLYGIGGCTDTLACNYDSIATVNDGSCSYAISPFDCSGNCANGGTILTLNLIDSYGDGWNGGILTVDGVDYTIVNGASEVYLLCLDLSTCINIDYIPGQWPSENSFTLTYPSNAVLAGMTSGAIGFNGTIGTCVPGCTDSSAFNYNPLAQVDDGSCFAVVQGCTDSLAVNYNPLANFNDNSCLYGIGGCTDTLACNYDSLATVNDGSCSYAIWPLDCSGNCANGGIQVVYTPGSWSHENGFTITDCNGTVLATMTSGSGYDSCIVLGTIYTINLTDSYGDGWNGGVLTIDGVDYTIATGSAAIFEVGTCPIPGCTDSLAVNYNPLATVDDNSCLYGIGGCTDTLACNYDSLATVNDGSCSYAISPLDCSGNCVNGGVEVVYTPGSWSNENSFTITDCNGTVLATMTSGSGYDTCIVLGAIYTINLTDSYGDGWNGGLLT